MPHHARPRIVDWRMLLPALLLLAGCLPHSCSGTGSAALLPADSLSRRVARTVPVDTLRRVWETDTSAGLQFPRTALFLPKGSSAGRLAVSDAKRGALLFFSKKGQRTRTVTSKTFAAPYLIGRRADTLLVLSPRERRVDFILVPDSSTARTATRPVRSLTLALPPVKEAPLLWATATGGAFFAKTIDADGQATVRRLDAHGHVTARRTLPGPRWHHAGPLRPWRDSLLSLSGYRAVAHRLPPSLGALDSLRLRGFDSPMLARTRRYATGDISGPPLLMPDVAATGRLLFVLNLRAGRLRIDAFGPGGQLQRRLVGPGPVRHRDVYPRALAARRRRDGSYALAVALTAPHPAVALYTWRPAPADSAASPLAKPTR